MDSAANTIATSEETVAKLQPLNSKAPPLALEIAINVTGARPAASSGQRDLFSEDTSTLLVFENGAVIRLAAAVVVGQLLFLTEKKANAEVVCQVVRKRYFRPTECYVEIEFTESMPNYWGVQLPSKADAPAKSETERMVESAEPAEDDVAPEVPAVSGHEVENLKQEVDALRAQIQELLKIKADAAKTEAAREDAAKRAEVAASEVTRMSAPAQATSPSPAVNAGNANTSPAPPAAGNAAPTPSGPAAPAPPMIRMTLPKAAPAKEGAASDTEKIDPLDCLLPKPDLDFSRAPNGGTARVSQSLYDIYKPVRAGIGKFPLAAISVLVLAIFLGGAWRMNWVRLPWLGSYSTHRGSSQAMFPASSSKSESGIVQTTTPGASAAASVAVPLANKPSATPKSRAAETSSHSTSRAAEGPSEPATAESGAGFTGPATSAALDTAKPVAPTSVPKHSNAKESGAAAVSRGKSAPSATSSASAQPATPEPAASDAAIVPPKLLKSVPPVYPPEAMENYITGDVRVDAVVGPDGKIGAMKILTGPASLRQAAIDALKQYEYTPATQGGRAVTAHVTATVKFWFNP